MRGPHELRRELWVPRPLDEVFAFFSDARNLEILTPGSLRFQILTTGPMRIAPGTRIEYKLSWHRVPLHWTTEIVRWDPPHLFEDRQLAGPYRQWQHTHRFEAAGGGTRMTDVVLYALPFGYLGRAVHALSVRRSVESIFNYRYQKILELFGGPAGRQA